MKPVAFDEKVNRSHVYYSFKQICLFISRADLNILCMCVYAQYIVRTRCHSLRRTCAENTREQTYILVTTTGFATVRSKTRGRSESGARCSLRGRTQNGERRIRRLTQRKIKKKHPPNKTRFLFGLAAECALNEAEKLDG